MRLYRITKLWLSTFLAVYFVIGLITEVYPGREVFPFFSWFLFTLAPQAGERYALILHEVNGTVVDPPRIYQDADGLVPNVQSDKMAELIQRLGAAIEQGETGQERQFRQLLEANYLFPNTRYDIVRIDFDPVVRWKTGRYTIKPLKTAASKEASP
jgi:hypothetical protein